MTTERQDNDTNGYADAELPVPSPVDEFEADLSAELAPPVPPDGGWGWVVVGASLLINIIVDGVCFSYGVFYVEFLRYFQESKSKTAWVGSLIPGMYLCMGPFSAALANKFGCRLVTMVGGVLAAIFFIISIFSPNVDCLIFTYGVCGGISFGLMYLPSIVIVNFYFERHRATATGIAVAGSGVGTFVFAPLAKFLIQSYGWKGANLIIAGIILNCVCCGAVFRPLLPEVRPHAPGTPPGGEGDLTTPPRGGMMQRIAEERGRCRTVSTGSMDGKVITTDNRVVMATECELPPPGDEVKVKLINGADSPPKHVMGNGSVPSPEMVRRFLQNDGLHGNRLRTTSTSSAVHRQAMLNQTWRSNMGSRSLAASRATLASVRSMSKDDQVRAKDLARPMSRDDIFFTGSVRNLDQYKHDPGSYTQSVTHIPSSQQTLEDRSRCGRLAPALSALRRIFEISLFKSLTFNIVCCASVFAMLGFFTPFVYINGVAKDMGVGPYDATMLISYIGVANIVGRIASGLLSDRPWVDCLLIHNFALIIGGAATMCVPWISNYPLLVAYCVLFGLCIAAYISLRTAVLVSLLGMAKLSASFGILLLFQGIASVVGSPLMGMLYDHTKSYTMMFLISGGLISLAGTICLPIRRIARWESAREASRLGVEMTQLREHTS